MPFSVGIAACLLAGGGPLVALATCLLALEPAETTAGTAPVTMTAGDLAVTSVDAAGRCDDARRSREGPRDCEPSPAQGHEGSASGGDASSAAAR